MKYNFNTLNSIFIVKKFTENKVMDERWQLSCPGLIPVNDGVADPRDAREGEDGAYNRDTPQEVDRHWKESSKDGHEAVDLNDHPEYRPTEEEDEDSTKETETPL